jgi:hypothetical protein
MRHRFIILLFAVCLFCLPAKKTAAQQSANDTIRLGGVVTEQGDTLAMVFLPDILKTAPMPRHIARQRVEWNRLRYNVYKVYPYAVIAASVLKDVDANLARCADKQARKTYLKTVEKELNKRFKGELEELTITQGQILVKLISRQTGRNCYGIIKEVKGGFSAVVWQSVALLFSNNLKREYDPYDRDKDIEAVVQEIEAGRRY